MAVSYLEPIPELRDKKAIEFEEKMKSVKPDNLSEKELQMLAEIKVAGKSVYISDK